MSLIKLKPGWKKMTGISQWRGEYKILLEEAKLAAQQDAAAPRAKVAAYLAGFIQESYPQNDEMDKLDDLASQLGVDILQKTIDERLASISARTAQYVQIEKKMKTVAKNAEDAAGAIRLEGILGFIQSASDTISSTQKLIDSLDSSKSSDRKVEVLITTAVADLEKLRSAVSKLI